MTSQQYPNLNTKRKGDRAKSVDNPRGKKTLHYSLQNKTSKLEKDDCFVKAFLVLQEAEFVLVETIE